MEDWRVILAESEPLIRQEMVRVVTEIPGLVLVARVTNGWDVIFTCAQLKPDMVLLDIRLPGLSGIEVTSLIRRGLPGLATIIMLDDENDNDMNAVRQCGAWGCLLKSRLAQELPSLVGRLRQNLGDGAGPDGDTYR